jgi:catechol 2,3-dioxygenase-like lactoylglutathione lyase family enzyme
MVRALGINHLALEVGDLDQALAWYGRLFELKLRGRRGGMAWIDLGDQFLALAEGRSQSPDEERHFGLVVDDKEALRAQLRAEGIPIPEAGGLMFRDPWGNNIQVVDYRDVQFSKVPEVLAVLVPEGLPKRRHALEELAAKGMAPVQADEG